MRPADLRLHDFNAFELHINSFHSTISSCWVDAVLAGGLDAEAEVLVRDSMRHRLETVTGDLRHRVEVKSLKRGPDHCMTYRFSAIVARTGGWCTSLSVEPKFVAEEPDTRPASFELAPKFPDCQRNLQTRNKNKPPRALREKGFAEHCELLGISVGGAKEDKPPDLYLENLKSETTTLHTQKYPPRKVARHVQRIFI